MQMWPLGIWLSGGLGRTALMVGLDDLKYIFQPKRFCDLVVVLWSFILRLQILCVLLIRLQTRVSEQIWAKSLSWTSWF